VEFNKIKRKKPTKHFIKKKNILLIDEGDCFYLLHGIFFFFCFSDLLNIISCLKKPLQLLPLTFVFLMAQLKSSLQV